MEMWKVVHTVPSRSIAGKLRWNVREHRNGDKTVQLPLHTHAFTQIAVCNHDSKSRIVTVTIFHESV